MRISIAALFSVTVAFAGCAADPGGSGGLLSSNAAKVYIYTPEEQAGMTPEGTMETMMTPSEIRERFKNAGKVTKPTGEVNYCDAGLPQLVQSRRNEALAAIAEACGGDDQYRIRHEGLGNVKARYLGNFKLTPSCTRSKVIIFRCNGVQPKPDSRK
ncbi:MAG: hypothetical protein K2X51_11845 [Burkholderiales bacterium]|nr:hypothetical protein [Burkholderiales bacterium]